MIVSRFTNSHNDDFVRSSMPKKRRKETPAAAAPPAEESSDDEAPEAGPYSAWAVARILLSSCSSLVVL
jgi:hypothetical protein